MESMEAPEHEMGMEVYYTSTLGTGGELKSSPEDFRVREVIELPEERDEGEYLLAWVTTRNWETNRLLDVLSRELGIPRGDIGFAGTKDKRAVTTQTMTFPVSAGELDGLELAGVEVEPVYRVNRGLLIGDLRGNMFEIR